MREKYIELMEKTLSAYSEDHITRYFGDVKQGGLKEHGFPRLASDIGILIAHGRRHDLLPIFLDMMEFCCKSIPVVNAANDFSVREVVGCIREIEESGVVDPERIARWKGYLSTIDPYTCYDIFTRFHEKNWALFTCVSELFRQNMGLCSATEFIDTQLASQFQWIDENGMYMDNSGNVHHHMNYDLVPRGLFVMLLNAGYRGKYYKKIDDILRRAALLTLKMQSPNGEIAFGGRSNQFLYNEEWMIVIYEYEARRYVREGNFELSGVFKAAAKRALDVTEHWLSLYPIRHIKNRFPTETKFGCEDYAYFDKYMITVASNLHDAYLVCDDSIPTPEIKDHTPQIFMTSEHFHKLFVKAAGYGIEFDFNADARYDASGLGRIQKEGAPSTVCMAVPCPKDPIFTVDLEKPIALSFAPGIMCDGEWKFATDPDVGYELVDSSKTDSTAKVNVLCRFDKECVSTSCTVGADGISIEVSGSEKIAYMLPAFYFDGEAYTDIIHDGCVLNVSYKDWVCRYTSSAPITGTEKLGANRNGHYKQFITSDNESINIHIEIFKSSN